MTFISHAKIFALNKPVNKTTYDMIRFFKKEFKQEAYKKIGHFGTLDPFAQGLVLIGVNGACRLNDFAQQNHKKTYQAIGLFGKKTDTQDRTGKILEEDPQWLKKITIFENKQDLESFLQQNLLGNIQQTPSAFSALKLNGIPLYKYARSGELIQKDARNVEIFSLKILEILPDYAGLKFEVTVSSGTYIRSFFEQIAQLLGTIGYLDYLERIQIGNIHLDNLDSTIVFSSISLDLFLDLPIYYLKNEQEKEDFHQGRKIHHSNSNSNFLKTYYVATNKNENFEIQGVAISELSYLQPKIVFQSKTSE